MKTTGTGVCCTYKHISDLCFPIFFAFENLCHLSMTIIIAFPLCSFKVVNNERMYGRIFTGLLACVVLGCSLLVTALIAGENRILLRPGLDPRGKQFYVNRLQAFCE